MGEGDDPTARVLDLYGEATIVGGLRWTGTDNIPGGVTATVALADRAARHGFTTGGVVVDVGHSTGAPGRFVARRFGVTVVGVDINPYEEGIARAAARREGLARRCVPTLARAELLPLRDASADGAWSQDAMLHMDKRRVIAEVSRVLRPGSVFALTDFVDRGGLSAAEASEVDEMYAAPELFDAVTYVEVLDACGFAIRHLEDRTAEVWGPRNVGFDEAEWWDGYVATYGEAARVWIHRIRRWGELVAAGHAGHLLVVAERL